MGIIIKKIVKLKEAEIYMEYQHSKYLNFEVIITKPFILGQV